MTRDPFPTRSIRLVGPLQVQTAIALLNNLPIDADKPIQVLVREEPKLRRPDANALMWAGPLADIAEQAYVKGRRYSAEVWHEALKDDFLPAEFDPELTKEGYVKYDITPSGKRVLVGSTTQLTVRGFSQYLEQVHAFGASLGVVYTQKERAA